MNFRRPVQLAVLLIALVVSGSVALALEQGPTKQPMGNGMSNEQMQMMHQQMVPGSQTSDTATPTMPGQDAFGAIQEIVRILESDPKTKWSKVNLEALRQHLIDMSEVTLKADAVTKLIDDGIEVTITGTGRTVEAIQRMVPAHAHQVDQTHLNGWSAKTEPLPNGVLLTVTSGDPLQVQHIRGLGFIGVMASGSHHQAHHLAMTKGRFLHHSQ
jgi:MFS superfamily sulfate permease-like transporter